MLGIGDKLPSFAIVGVKPGFHLQEEKGQSLTLRDGASVEELIRALNSIGAGPRDIIAILQAIKAQGALHAELEII